LFLREIDIGQGEKTGSEKEWMMLASRRCQIDERRGRKENSGWRETREARGVELPSLFSWFPHHEDI
jgi:hypothetical protein